MSVSLENSRSKIHPWKFALMVGCGSIAMMFAAWTSAYVVRHAAGNWLEFRLPNIFFVSAAVILSSSITLHLSRANFKKKNEKAYKFFLIATLILGLSFVVLQYLGWQSMKEMGVPLTKNPSGDFIYVLTGFHAVHVLGGVGALVVAIVHAFALRFNPTPKRLLRLEMTSIYWHFVDILWLYLLGFFVTQG
jgi:cytochrome c oxidase subunit III